MELLTKQLFWEKGKFLGHVLSPEGIQLIPERVKDLKSLKSSGKKKDVMKVSGYFGFYCCYIKNLHLDSHFFYISIKESTAFYWTHEHEKLFKSIKDRNSQDKILAVPCTVSFFRNHVGSTKWTFSNSTVS